MDYTSKVGGTTNGLVPRVKKLGDDSPHPVIISKNLGFRAIYLAIIWNEFRFFFV